MKIWAIPLIVGFLFLAACSPVSEEEYNELVAERDEIRQKLIEAEKANTVLNESIEEIYKEREALQVQLQECRLELQALAARDQVENTEEDNGASETDQSSTSTGSATTTPTTTTDDSGAEYYTVKSGDTLSGIADELGVPLARIRELNDLEDDFIRENQKLRIR